MKLLLLLALTSAFSLLPSVLVLAAEAVPGILNYQGRLAAAGTNFDGTAQFKFALVNGDSSVTYWSHDGTSTAGSEPAGAVSLPVRQGLFAVNLGDTTLANMTVPVPVEVFAHSDVRLRLWVSDGVSGFTQLTPDQRVTAVGYAMMAANVPAGAIQSGQLAAGAVNTTQIADQAVTTDKIADGTLTAADLSPALASNTFWRLNGNASTIAGTHFLGTTDNQPLELRVNGLRVLRFEDNGDSNDFDPTPDGAPNVVAGSPVNFVGLGVVGATISGGGATNYAFITRTNAVLGNYGTVGGGLGNRVDAASLAGTIGGGFENTVGTNASYSAIGGGYINKIADSSASATIAGGSSNDIGTNSGGSAIGGGYNNNIAANAGYATIPGGANNAATNYAFAAGRRAKALHEGTFVWADSANADFASTANRQFLIRAGGGVGINKNNPISTLDVNGTVSATVFFGNGSGLTGLDADTLEGLSPAGFWQLGGNAGTIPGTRFLGTTDDQPLELKVNGLRALRLEPNASEAPNVIGGAHCNRVPEGIVGATIAGGGAAKYEGSNYPSEVRADFGTIGGGSSHVIDYGADSSTISGGYNNEIFNAMDATVGGGRDNYIGAACDDAVIAGGQGNVISFNCQFSTIGGGYSNLMCSSPFGATIAGGRDNLVGHHARYAFIGGGRSNTVWPPSAWQSDCCSTIAGGFGNTIGVGSDYSMIPGGWNNSVGGSYAFAAGREARASHDGSFVWADSQDTGYFESSGDNEVSFRCAGGVRFTSGSGGDDQTVSWTPGSGAWSFTSDRCLKESISAVDAHAVLDKVSRLPISEWYYKGYAQRHIGPMAQDFHALFPLNESQTTLNSADLDGVALAAIQGLNQKVEDRSQRSEVRSRELEAKNAALEKELAELKALVKTLAAKVNGGGQ